MLELLEFHKINHNKGVFYFRPLPDIPSDIQLIADRLAPFAFNGMAATDPDKENLESVDTRDFLVDWLFNQDFTEWRGFKGPKDIWETYLLGVEGDIEGFRAAWGNADARQSSDH